jgi:GT2 family glycosyltransferase
MFNYDFDLELPMDGGTIKQEILELKKGNIVNEELKIFGNRVEQEFIIDDVHLLKKKKKRCAVMSVKDNPDLLRFTLSNFRKNNVFEYIDLIVVDDRPSNSAISEVCKESQVSYLKVFYDGLFNFSMVNNIAIHFALNLGYEEVILWSSDLWVVDEQNLINFFKTHERENSKISGAVLLYPPEHMSFRERKEKIDISNTIQFGGYFPLINNNLNTVFPNHYGRYEKSDSLLFKNNRYDIFTTGALILMDIEAYKESGGLNPSFKINFQDVDLCHKFCEMGYNPLIISERCRFYHDEGVSLQSNEVNEYKKLEALLHAKLWDIPRMSSILPMGFLK